MAYTISKENGTSLVTRELIALESPIAESNGQDSEKIGINGISGQVAEKWRGTQSDKHVHQHVGFIKHRHCKFGNTTSTIRLLPGRWRTADMFWDFIVGTFGMSLVYASIAEVASIFKSFLAISSPSAIGWQVYLTRFYFMVALIIQVLIALNVENYVRRGYHDTLLTIAVLAFSVIFNTSISLHLPMIESVIHALDVLLDFSNEGGWPSEMIGYDWLDGAF
ncbi:hypothetical protein BTUL_0029g00770 [Botrytis tulipae]|uniref:Uncharacterized protein n=1 Tax=Botrytis tulipae TaxID=87230 RepID=A0A4Z1EWA1_9HELO|nr:hypothetical protein BTUL_0029g00770 [Botrytis tulipae]